MSNKNLKNQNIQASIQSTLENKQDSEVSKTGYKEKELMPSRKNMQR